jgi:general secretion pathway protein D
VLGSTGVPGQLTYNEVRNFNSGLVRLNFQDPLAAAQLRSQATSADLLANPRVRVRNKQSAKILIGERVPVFTTTATANVGTFESVNYLDVGLKLEIEPTVSLDDEVSMKMALEVSNILDTITRASGTQAYRLGTRNTSTTLRVHDGETNILAGLIQRDERRSNTGVPGLNEIPVLSKLFGAAQDTDNRTEIVLLVTPHIIRNVELPGLGLQEFLSGTDASVGAAPIQLGNSRPGANAPATRPQGLIAPSPMPAPVLPSPTQGQPGSQMPAVPREVAVPGPAGPAPAFTPPPLIPASPGADGSSSSGSGGAGQNR